MKKKNTLREIHYKVSTIETLHTPNHTEEILIQKEEMNIENLKRVMFEKKIRLPSLRNQDWKTVKAETEKINEFTHISTNNITELNELINAKRN